MLLSLDAFRSSGRVVLVHPSSDHVRVDGAYLVTMDETLRVSASSLPNAHNEDELTTTIRRELLSVRTEMVRQAAARPASKPATLPTISRHD
jgi:hypothetical protein